MIARIEDFIGREYPYAYARASAKRAKLLETEDYERLMKMGPSEIARNLEEGDYRREIEEFGDSHSGAGLVELAVKKNYSRTMEKMVEICPEPLASALKIFAKREQAEAAKRKIRGSDSNGATVFEPEGSTVEELLEDLSDGSGVSYLDEAPEKPTPQEAEAAIERALVKELKMLASGNGAGAFSEFVNSEIEHENTINASRLLKEGYASDRLREVMPEELSERVEAVMRSKDIDEAIGTVSQAYGLEAQNLQELERELERRRLEEALRMMHSEPLSATSVLGYAVAKRIESQNLMRLARAREAGMEPEEIREELVIRG